MAIKATATATTRTAPVRTVRTTRPHTDKTREKEPRGRPANGTRTLTGSTADDPLLTIQIPTSLKVLTSLWDDLAQAAIEKKWHRSVLVREILVEWVEGWKKGKSKGKKRSASARKKPAETKAA